MLFQITHYEVDGCYGNVTITKVKFSATLKPVMSSIWIDAYQDYNAKLNTFSTGLALGDLAADGDSRLVVAHVASFKAVSPSKMKVYCGTAVASEINLPEIPSSVCVLFRDLVEPKIPVVAVACGTNVLVYKSNKPFYKLSLPPLEVQPVEKELWDQAKEENNSPSVLFETLLQLKQELGASLLTSRTLRFLSLQQENLAEFVESYKSVPLQRQSTITCMTTMFKGSAEERSISVLILGTEHKNLHFVEPEAFSFVHTATLPAVPSALLSMGLYDVDYELIVGTRNAKIYSLSRSGAAKLLVKLDAHFVSLVKEGESSFAVALTNLQLQGYSTKGHLLWKVTLSSAPLCLTTLHLSQKGKTLLVVGTNDGNLSVYKEGQLVESSHLGPDRAASALIGGKFGREENTLVIITLGGELVVKIVNRAANLEPKEAPQIKASLGVMLPKKSKLFIEQASREMENSTAIHYTFQRQLCELRLQAAQGVVKALEQCQDLSGANSGQVSVTIQLYGLGPKFLLKMLLINLSDKVHQRLTVFIEPEQCWIEKRSLVIPYFPPMAQYCLSTFMESRSQGVQLKMWLVPQNGQEPLLHAIVQIPPCEGEEVASE